MIYILSSGLLGCLVHTQNWPIVNFCTWTTRWCVDISTLTSMGLLHRKWLKNLFYPLATWVICRGSWDNTRHKDTRRSIGIALEVGIAIYPVSCQSAPMMYVLPALLLLCLAGVASIADEQCKVGEDSGYDEKIAICVKFHPMFSWWLQYIYIYTLYTLVGPILGKSFVKGIPKLC